MLRGLPHLAKEIIENFDKSKNTKHLIFPICFLSKGDIFHFFFTNLVNSKLISELVSSDKSVFLCFYATIKTSFDKHSNFNLRKSNNKIQRIKL